jgi:hypothetical protein
MKQIGNEIGVNESRVSQLHARALDRLKRLLAADMGVHESANEAAVASARLSIVREPKMTKARLRHAPEQTGEVSAA